ncbi:MAG: DUF2162 domain-containing protein [Trichlorobacter sp.]|nr:DUF2162 domain-containing protein [Trichlorobacter sp.]
MSTDLDILLWSGGTLFSLGIFAAKTGMGLGYGRFGRVGVLLTLGLYLVLFQVTAHLTQRLLHLLEPLLRDGPWLHEVMAAGMIIWGIILIVKPEGKNCRTPASSLTLLIPCPVCLTAITFSTWTALQTLPFPSWGVGLAMGGMFSLLTLIIMFIARKNSHDGGTPSLGLAMIAIGLYYIASLFLPAKVEQTKGMYGSFVTELQPATVNGADGMVLLLLVGVLLAVLCIGFFLRKGDCE